MSSRLEQFMKDVLTEPGWNLYKVLADHDKLVAMHPHNNCSVCHGINEPAPVRLDAHEQFEVLLASFRQSAQDTLGSLDRKGYEIVKRQP